MLRHKPEALGIVLDSKGYTDTKILIDALKEDGFDIDIDILKDIVETNDKQRFKFNEDFSKIRASQGHSVIKLDFVRKLPPDILYHGTAKTNMKSIMKSGISKQRRHHVHLSTNKDTALDVGGRYGRPIVLEIDAKKMNADNIEFYLSDNNVWLTEYVDSKYIINNK